MDVLRGGAAVDTWLRVALLGPMRLVIRRPAWGLLVCACLGLGIVPARAERECTLFTQETFPLGTVWWRVGPERGAETGIRGFPEGRAAYLVTGVRPDGVLVQNREARYPRVLSWTVLARSQVSTDGRRTWRRGCADAGAK